MDFRSFAKGPVQLARDFRPEKQFLSLKAVGGEGLTRKFRRVDRKSSEADHIVLNLDNFMAFVRFIGAFLAGRRKDRANSRNRSLSKLALAAQPVVVNDAAG